jgi:hypothetical protein
LDAVRADDELVVAGRAVGEAHRRRLPLSCSSGTEMPSRISASALLPRSASWSAAWWIAAQPPTSFQRMSSSRSPAATRMPRSRASGRTS